MEQRRLGTSGFTVSLLGLGTNNFGGRSDESEARKVIDAAIDIGANFFDTANIYTGTNSETIIGKALKGRRDKVVLTTKFGMSMGKGPNMMGGSRGHIISQLEGSLQRLQTDYLDLYQMHAVDRETPIEETLRALDDMVRSGKVRYIGCSNYDAWHLVEAMHTSRALNLNSFVTVQPYYNLLKREVERELVPACKAYGVGIIPYFPLESGFLTGKYRPGEAVPAGTRFEKTPTYQGMLNEGNFAILSRLEEFASDQGHTVGELAMAWLAARPQVCSIISGASTPEQVEANAKGLEWKLTSEDLDEIDKIVPA